MTNAKDIKVVDLNNILKLTNGLIVDIMSKCTKLTNVSFILNTNIDDNTVNPYIM